jgi:hypothetical protein
MTQSFALKNTKTGMFYGIRSERNPSSADFCGSHTNTLVPVHDVIATFSEENAVRALSVDTPWYNSTPENPHWPHDFDPSEVEIVSYQKTIKTEKDGNTSRTIIETTTNPTNLKPIQNIDDDLVGTGCQTFVADFKKANREFYRAANYKKVRPEGHTQLILVSPIEKLGKTEYAVEVFKKYEGGKDFFLHGTLYRGIRLIDKEKDGTGYDGLIAERLSLY